MGTLGCMSESPGEGPAVKQLIPVLLLSAPGEAHLDEAALIPAQVSCPLLQPPFGGHQEDSGQETPAVPGISPRRHRIPQELTPAAERPFRIEPAAELAPRPQQRLVDHLGGFIAVIITADRQEPFIRQPDDDLPVGRRAVGSAEHLPDIGPLGGGEVIHEYLPDNSPVGFAEAVQDSVRVSSEGTVEAAYLFICVKRQTVLPRSQRPPHLVQGELKERQRPRTITDRSGQFAYKPVGNLHAAPHGRGPDRFGQLAPVHAPQRNRVLTQPFPEGSVAHEKGSERILSKGQDYG